ncbi:unnamed protein product [Oncorhynchus mykiss]|uniref:Uncharacterized protein n=1 Tax=Oncorhynchus mykiss TaxID=8022 RepID=A0A060WUD3_ONCMY|nr:unnamed protein product [Oncorhynchus mykiss]
MILAPSCDSSIGHLTILQQVTAIILSSIGGPIMSSRERQKGNMTKDSVSLLPCFYFVELPILVSSVVSLYFLELTDVFKPVRSGYSCHDRSLSLPYIESTHEIIPLLMLLSLAFAGPAITVSNTHTQTQAGRHACMCTNTHTGMLARQHTHTNMHTFAHVHTQAHMPVTLSMSS